MDGLSSLTEQQLYSKVSKQINCCFMIKFWAMYWFSHIYYRGIGLFGTNQVASEFIEHFTFVMHMKNQVVFQLSMRNMAQIYHYFEQQTTNSRQNPSKQEDLSQAEEDIKLSFRSYGQKQDIGNPASKRVPELLIPGFSQQRLDHANHESSRSHDPHHLVVKGNSISIRSGGLQASQKRRVTFQV